jgi:hypothetical protein
MRDSLLTIIEELTHLLRAKREQLTGEEKEKINSAADEMANVVDGLTAQAIQGTALQIQESVQEIRIATNNAVNALRKLGNIRNGISIITALIGLGTSIASGNPTGIISAARGVLKSVNQIDIS